MPGDGERPDFTIEWPDAASDADDQEAPVAPIRRPRIPWPGRPESDEPDVVEEAAPVGARDDRSTTSLQGGGARSGSEAPLSTETRRLRLRLRRPADG